MNPGDLKQFSELVYVVSNFGISGIVAILWYFTNKSHAKTLEKYREDLQQVKDIYKNSISLVQKYESLATDLHGLIILNTQTLQKVNDSINTNQYCPYVRLIKESDGPR